MSHCAHCGFDGKWKTQGSLRGLGFERKKGNIFFQKAEAQIEATPMLFFHANDVAKQFVEQQAIKFQHIILREPCAAEVVRGHSKTRWREAEAGRDAAGGRVAAPAPGQHQRLSPRSCESRVMGGRRMVYKRVRLLRLVHLYHFQQLIQDDAGSCDVRTLLIENSPMRYLCAHRSGCASEPDGTREHLQALVLVPFYPYFLIHFFSCRSFCAYTEGKSSQSVWEHSFPSLGFLNVTWSKVLAFLPCRIDASGAGWHHLHTPELTPSLYHLYSGIQAVGLRSV